MALESDKLVSVLWPTLPPPSHCCLQSTIGPGFGEHGLHPPSPLLTAGPWEPFGLGRCNGHSCRDKVGRQRTGRGRGRRQGRSKEQDMRVVGDLGGLQGLHIPQGTSSEKFHAPVRTHKIKDVLPYATIHPEQVMRTSLPLITGGEAD